MAIRTASTTARSSSHSTQSAPKKSSSAQRSGSTSRSSAPTQSKQTSSAPKRDTFTRSTPTARQTPSKTSATSTAKTSTASKSSQAKTSAAKSNTTAKTGSSKTVTKAKSNPTASKAKRDSFEFSSEAVKKSVQSAKSSKSSANSKAATKSNAQNSANAQTKKAVKNNSSSKGSTSGNVSKDKANSSQKKMLESIKKAYAHTKDPKQRAAMRKTMNDISREISSKKTGTKQIDLSVNKSDRIKCQKDTWNGGDGWSGCYSESMDAMWRVNHPNKLSADETHILQNDDATGSIEWGCEDYKYNGSIVVNGKEYTGIVYPGIDSNGNKYEALRLRELSKSDAEKIMNNELENGRAFCYRVYNTEALDQGDGHTLLCTGRLADGTYTYSNCATAQKKYQINKPLSEQYNNKKYYERSENIELIIDITA